MKGGVPSVDGLQSGQGASHRNLRGHLADGWEMVNEQIGFHKEKQARTVFHIDRDHVPLCIHVVFELWQPLHVVVDSLMELQCKMVLSNHFDSSVLVTLISGQSLTEPTPGPNSQALRRRFRRISLRPSGQKEVLCCSLA